MDPASGCESKEVLREKLPLATLMLRSDAPSGRHYFAAKFCNPLGQNAANIFPMILNGKSRHLGVCRGCPDTWDNFLHFQHQNSVAP